MADIKIKKEQEVHLALYRKYRPADLDEVIGQDHIVSVLKTQIQTKTIGHAYLFAGSRGTGKTTVARILARSAGTTETDLYEMDAASNRGIDEMRSLREGIHTPPFDSARKTYILDEAHMLTKEAWNALLKVLEEPPIHALFILATTELEKVPETIQSRCQTFVFRKPSPTILKEVIARIAKKEGYTLEPASIELVALLADGSFRDAQAILEKVLGTSRDKKIGVKEVEEVTGAPSGELVNAVLSAINEKNIEKGFSALRKAESQNIDIRVFTKLLLNKCRAVLLIRFAPEIKKELLQEHGETGFALLEGIAKNRSSGVTSSALRLLISAAMDIPFSAIPVLPLELALSDICAPPDTSALGGAPSLGI